MKTKLLAALLTAAFVSAAGAATITMSPPSGKVQPQTQSLAQPKVIAAPAPEKSAPTKTAPKQLAPAKTAVQAKADCPCNCPPHRKVRQSADVRSSHMRRQVRGGYYRYAAAAPFRWHEHWRAAPNDALIPGPMAAPGYEVEGLSIEDRGWTGGVGTAADGGGGGGGFTDGYGQAHFANGGSVENGPSYNSYGQSFQYNPSQAGPFQPRLMGGFAPPR